MQTGSTTPRNRPPFHAGEVAAQARAGVADSVAAVGRQLIRPYLPEQHRQFYSALPFLVAAARDPRGRPWATLLTGSPGFLRAPDEHRLLIDALPAPGDALHGALGAGSALGLLGIDLASRRRNRVNGRVAGSGPPLEIDVAQAFGNCPQYIHPRTWRRVEAPAGAAAISRSRRLDAQARAWIEGADTLFLASGYGGDGEPPLSAAGMDASHRGGPPGFVRVAGDTRLVLPDYAGNNYFNTLGNLVMDPRVGLLFVDFEQGSLLQITGRAAIDWQPAASSGFSGARRLVSVDIDECVILEQVLPLRWSAPGQATRTLRVADRIRETPQVESFLLESRDGGPLPGFQAGQHLPLEVRIPGHEEPLARSYSLSGDPAADRYRISVKREPHGTVSRHLHDQLRAGDLLEAGSPAGDFVLRRAARPVVLIGAGIGVTPLLSMLHALARDPRRTPAWLIQGARNGREHAFAREVRALAAAAAQIHVHVAYSRPAAGDLAGRDYDHAGRIDVPLVEGLLPSLDADFYLCGPAGLLAALAAGLARRGVPAASIHTENFGPPA